MYEALSFPYNLITWLATLDPKVLVVAYCPEKGGGDVRDVVGLAKKKGMQERLNEKRRDRI